MDQLIKDRINESINVKSALLENHQLLSFVDTFADSAARCISAGGKLVICGNGGSASDALHFAGEIVGRFKMERNAWPAVVLNADVATMTAIANDYGYEDVFARQAQAFITDKDIFVGISTSGNSENVYRALQVAKEKGAKTVALLGKDGGRIAPETDIPIVVPCMETARVQESHIMIIHIVCELVEKALADE